MKQKKFMLATDLDGTFVGNEEGLADLLAYYEEAPYDVALVYITGRHLDSAKSLIQEVSLPEPDLLITDVGTAIYHQDGEDSGWKRKMNEHWQPDRIAEIASDFPELKRQQLPNDRRVSYTVDNNPQLAVKFQQRLEQEDIPHAFIFSSNQDIDVLPPSAGKGKALEHVIEHYAAPDVQLLIAGDSGNDIDMLSLGHPAVIVGNAQQELLDIDDHPNLFRAQAHCAAGIHEAWLHFYDKKDKHL
ncbi:HAD-IIB family hydrolase [Sporosarcina sp. Te-1]|uniref:HAD-IIB family hydrolase n=1 Tax=Sporosarcina sp. Te-1 TaxID=2818390 RepID=UPI001FB18ABB|nr:HAD-IIB family hydrolase [Sporosarcina sp. Te-1]